MRRFLALMMLGIVVGVWLTPATAQAGFGIDPGKVYIDNLHPGAEADVPITVYNHNDYETAFEVIAREPDYTAEGYEPFPYLAWITITPDRLSVAPGGQSEVLVVITMPEDADYSGKKSEVWICFTEHETTGMIKIEIASRLLISTRVESTSEPPETPAVHGNGSVDIITAEAGGAEPGFPWAILGSVLGALLVGGAVFFLVKRRQRGDV